MIHPFSGSFHTWNFYQSPGWNCFFFSIVVLKSQLLSLNRTSCLRIKHVEKRLSSNLLLKIAVDSAVTTLSGKLVHPGIFFEIFFLNCITGGSYCLIFLAVTSECSAKAFEYSWLYCCWIQVWLLVGTLSRMFTSLFVWGLHTALLYSIFRRNCVVYAIILDPWDSFLSSVN